MSDLENSKYIFKPKRKFSGLTVIKDFMILPELPLSQVSGKLGNLFCSSDKIMSVLNISLSMKNSESIKFGHNFWLIKFVLKLTRFARSLLQVVSTGPQRRFYWLDRSFLPFFLWVECPHRICHVSILSDRKRFLNFQKKDDFKTPTDYLKS